MRPPAHGGRGVDELIEQFLIEGRELVEQATGDLLALEARPDDRARLDSLFRAIHTLKGSAGIVDFPAMQRALHAAEDTLADARSVGVLDDVDLIGDCLACLDQLVGWFEVMEATGAIPAGADAAADALMTRFDRGDNARVALPGHDRQPRPPVTRAIDNDGDLPPLSRQFVEAQIRLLSVADEDGLNGRVTSAVIVAARVLRQAGRPEAAARLEDSLAAHGAAGAAPHLVGMREQLLIDGPAPASFAAEALPSPAETPVQEVTLRALRVDVERIDALVRLTGELTVAKNALAHIADLARDGLDTPALAARLGDQRDVLDRLVGELQRSVLAIRVLAMRHIFQRFPRLVRELGAGLGKAVRLEIHGDDTEADKTIVEGLFEPLLHVLRNAIDHGLETPAERRAIGKADPAVVRLRALRDGDRVVVEVSDDGRGIDVDRVRRLAVERGLVTPEIAEAMDDNEAVDLIFKPGFSTAAEVTAVSGRGVGLDAVRVALARMGGRVRVENRPGHGATVRFILPFSVMMTRVMTVEAGGQVFGLPLDALVGSCRVERTAITPVGAAQVFIWRDRTVPLCDLATVLGVGQGGPASAEAAIVVARLAGEVMGLEVDRVGERMDGMLAPMAGILSGVAGVAGTSLLGDGQVLIVLDLSEIFA